MASSNPNNPLPVVIGGLVIIIIGSLAAYHLYKPGTSEPAVLISDPSKLPGDPVTGQPVQTGSGLMYYDLKTGDGALPSGPTSTVRVHYTGWLKNGKMFDSSVTPPSPRSQSGPAEFALNAVIPGWTEGVGSMKVGGKRKLIIPWKLAYGAEGRPPSIPPRADLVFDIELLAILN